jgi:hypothetical protein
MPTFRLLYLRDSLLEHAEEVEVQDVLEAVQKASGSPQDVRVEIWSESGRVGIIGRSSGR